MTDRIRALLVDDEPLALINLRAILQGSRVEIVGECADGQTALDACAELRPELVLLDVQMPGMDGIEVARRLVERGTPPRVVFVTAYDHFAVEAFEVHALDYLLKPYSDARLLCAVERCHAALRGSGMDDLAARLARFVDSQVEEKEGARRYFQRLLIPEAGRTRIVMAAEIIWIGGAKNYVEIHTERGTFLYRQSMDAMEAALDPRRFVRAHRSTIVCIDRVREIVSQDGRRSAILDDGVRLPISQGYADHLMRRLDR